MVLKSFIDDLRGGENIIRLEEFIQSKDCYNGDTIVIITSYKLKIIFKIYKKLINIPNHKFKIIETIKD